MTNSSIRRFTISVDENVIGGLRDYFAEGIDIMEESESAESIESVQKTLDEIDDILDQLAEEEGK